eukprot:1611229-Rhodomonas_salina.1
MKIAGAYPGYKFRFRVLSCARTRAVQYISVHVSARLDKNKLPALNLQYKKQKKSLGRLAPGAFGSSPEHTNNVHVVQQCTLFHGSYCIGLYLSRFPAGSTTGNLLDLATSTRYLLDLTTISERLPEALLLGIW